MKHTKEEIIGALKIIKEECASHTTCKTCPLWLPDGNPECNVAYQCPEDWKINNAEPEVWRALK